jgi:hypothetical protein
MADDDTCLSRDPTVGWVVVMADDDTCLSRDRGFLEIAVAKLRRFKAHTSKHKSDAL